MDDPEAHRNFLVSAFDALALPDVTPSDTQRSGISTQVHFLKYLMSFLSASERKALVDRATTTGRDNRIFELAIANERARPADLKDHIEILVEQLVGIYLDGDRVPSFLEFFTSPNMQHILHDLTNCYQEPQHRPPTAKEWLAGLPDGSQLTLPLGLSDGGPLKLTVGPDDAEVSLQNQFHNSFGKLGYDDGTMVYIGFPGPKFVPVLVTFHHDRSDQFHHAFCRFSLLARQTTKRSMGLYYRCIAAVKLRDESGGVDRIRLFRPNGHTFFPELKPVVPATDDWEVGSRGSYLLLFIQVSQHVFGKECVVSADQSRFETILNHRTLDRISSEKDADALGPLTLEALASRIKSLESRLSPLRSGDMGELLGDVDDIQYYLRLGRYADSPAPESSYDHREDRRASTPPQGHHDNVVDDVRPPISHDTSPHGHHVDASRGRDIPPPSSRGTSPHGHHVDASRGRDIPPPSSRGTSPHGHYVDPSRRDIPPPSSRGTSPHGHYVDPSRRDIPPPSSRGRSPHGPPEDDVGSQNPRKRSIEQRDLSPSKRPRVDEVFMDPARAARLRDPQDSNAQPGPGGQYDQGPIVHPVSQQAKGPWVHPDRIPRVLGADEIQGNQGYGGQGGQVFYSYGGQGNRDRGYRMPSYPEPPMPPYAPRSRRGRRNFAPPSGSFQSVCGYQNPNQGHPGAPQPASDYQGHSGAPQPASDYQGHNHGHQGAPPPPGSFQPASAYQSYNQGYQGAPLPPGSFQPASAHQSYNQGYQGAPLPPGSFQPASGYHSGAPQQAQRTYQNFPNVPQQQEARKSASPVSYTSESRYDMTPEHPGVRGMTMNADEFNRPQEDVPEPRPEPPEQ